MLELRQLIPEILKCAQDPLRWPEVLDDINRSLEITASCMFAVHEFKTVKRTIHWSEVNRRNVSAQDKKRMEEGSDTDDRRAYQFLFKEPSLTFYDEPTMFGVSKESSLPESSIRDLTQSLGYQMRYAATLNRDGPWLDGFFCQTRSAAEGRVLTQDKRINILLPLIAGSLELGRIFTTLRARYAAALTALDALGIAVVLVDGKGRVLERNQEAGEIIDQNDGIVIDRSGKLRAVSADETAALSSLIQQANDPVTSVKPALRMQVSRPSGKQNYLLAANALVDHAGEMEQDLRCAFLTMIDPERDKRISVNGLRDLGGLTPAETEVACLLVKGDDMARIAEIRSVSLHTVRTQARAISQKLRCSNQADLVRLAVATRLPVRN